LPAIALHTLGLFADKSAPTTLGRRIIGGIIYRSQGTDHPMRDLAAINSTRLTGKETLKNTGIVSAPTVQDFWQWSASDLLNNAMRGKLAEYIVASALGCDDGIRYEWDAYDLKLADGTKIEIKSAAYLQSWAQTRYSDISFGIQPTFGWDASTNGFGTEKKRQADIYIFCLLTHKDKASVNPLDMEQWRFYCLPTEILDDRLGDQKAISLNRLLALTPVEVRYSQLKQVISVLKEQVPGTL